MSKLLCCPHCGKPFRAAASNVIETYYRRKAAGGKVTLKQLAEETGYSVAGLKVAKQRYDAAGKWGSKTRKVKV
jgi:hypothetical protein